MESLRLFAKRHGALLLSVLLGMLALKVVVQLMILLLPQARGITGDAGTYLMIGRGILNGLTPYTDLFECKPPGIFLFSAAAHLLSDGSKFLSIFQVVIYALMPIIFGAFAWMTTRRNPDRGIATGCALIAGTLLALFAQERTIGVQPESFGAFFAVLYIFSAAALQGRNRIIACSILLLLSVGMKEPFLLGNLAGALLLSRNRRDFMEIFVLPLIIAASVGTLVMVVLGYAKGYFVTYLPSMFLYRLQSGTDDPLWLRTLMVHMPFGVLGRFSVLLGTLAAGLFLAVPWMNAKGRPALFSFIPLIIALLSLSLATGVGGYSPHHFLVAIPVFTALTVRAMAMQQRWRLLCMAILITAAAIYMPSAKALTTLQRTMEEQMAGQIRVEQATMIDALMDACGFDRVFGDLTDLLRHSPIGPIASTAYVRILGMDHPLMIETRANIPEADLIVRVPGESLPGLDTMWPEEVARAFTESPPSCAAPYVPMDGLEVLFRIVP